MEVGLDQIKGVGPNTLRILRNHHIWSTYDLILNYPKSYEDYSITSLDKATDKETLTIRATIITEPQMSRFAKGERITFKANVFKQTIGVVVFGRGYLLKQLKVNDEVVIKGVYHLYKNQIVAASITDLDKTVPIKPVYHIEGIHDRNLSTIIKTIKDEKQVSIYETIPQEFLTKYHLMNREKAFYHLHFPKNLEDIHAAERRFKYEEAFNLNLKLAAQRIKDHSRTPKNYDLAKVRSLIDQLPYELTQDQKDATNDIFRDFKKPYSSYRLIQGDVGSGKTVVVLLAIYAAITAGEQVSLMAPTELLANQHYQYFSSMLQSCHIALLSGKTKGKDQMKEAIKKHEYDLVIGTHALIENDVIFDNLGLVVIDEQHKFGVNTREELIRKTHSKDVIYLTATPIPRTLAMIAFGNTHVSLIKEKPQQRVPIETKYILKSQIDELYQMIRNAVSRNEHIFLVVPAIDSIKVTDNIDSVYDEISSQFNCPIFLLHGRLPQEEKERVMENFVYTSGSIMIATTMIEVGIDIPTATLIGIYAAEHFGLSQLHQLRGRVGRGDLKSSCYLISEKDDIERLQLLSKIDDGFVLSEYDLKSRGPGDFLGVEQSGFLKFNFLDLVNDYNILFEAQKNVLELIKRPDFKTNKIYKYLNKTITESLKI
ncbi:MAG: ATP-dependent DNA helicase RecG [Acholeplasmataceae bacterium]|nr:ATP-dependent DNA helicase RecG [Acholeplasmataceae bacterium]